MRLSRERLVLLLLLAAAVAVWGLVLVERSRCLTITVLDVGQGDSILIQAPSGRTMLIDGGGRAGEETRGYEVGRDVVLPALLARRVARLDLLVITHPHEDHVGGLPAVIAAVPVGMVLDPMLEEESEAYDDVRQLIAAKKVPLRRATEGQRVNLGDDIRIEVLNPPDPRLRGSGSEVTNNNSVVMRLECDGFSMLFAADTENLGAQRLARWGPEVQSTVLKVPHHGSSGILGTGLAEAVRPTLAVISVGARNPFGQPAPEVVEGLQRAGATVMRTDREGAITLRVRPPRWWARGYLGGLRARQVAGML